jgi:hypothetical protein
MNPSLDRRRFIAGLAASTAPMIGVAPLWGTCVPLPYKDPSHVLVELHERLNAAYKMTNEAWVANIFGANESGRSLKGTLHELS